MFREELTQTVLLVLFVSGIPLAVAAVLGLFCSFVQAVFQIQEQSISYCVKFVSVGAVLVLFADKFFQALCEYCTQIFSKIILLG